MTFAAKTLSPKLRSKNIFNNMLLAISRSSLCPSMDKKKHGTLVLRSLVFRITVPTAKHGEAGRVVLGTVITVRNVDLISFHTLIRKVRNWLL